MIRHGCTYDQLREGQDLTGKERGDWESYLGFKTVYTMWAWFKTHFQKFLLPSLFVVTKLALLPGHKHGILSQ